MWLYGALGNAAAAAMNTAGIRGSGKSMSETERDNISKAVADRLKDTVGSQVENLSQQVAEKIDEVLEVEFDPAPAATYMTIHEGYSVQNNVLIRFADDSIDQSHQLESALNLRGGCSVEIVTVAGTHVTPISGIPEDFWDSNPGNRPPRRAKRLGDAAAMAALGMDVEDDGKGKGSSREALVKEVLLCLSKLSSDSRATGRRRSSVNFALPRTERE